MGKGQTIYLEIWTLTHNQQQTDQDANISPTASSQGSQSAVKSDPQKGRPLSPVTAQATKQ